MKKRIFAALLAAAVCVSVLSGCGDKKEESKPAEPSVSSSESKPAESNPESKPEKTSAEQSESTPSVKPAGLAASEADGSLEGLREWGAENYPDAAAAVAFTGNTIGPYGGTPFWKGVNTNGYWPFMEDIYMDRTVQCTDEEVAVWCVVPMSPSSVITVSGSSGEEFYHSEDGQPILVLCADKRPDSGVTITVTDTRGRTSEYSPLLKNELESRQAVIPEDGSLFDFSVYRTAGTVPADWQMTGIWGFEDVFDEKNYILRLKPDGYAAYIALDNETGVMNSFYEGIWERTGPETILLDMPAVFADGQLPDIKGEYGCSLGLYNSMTLSVKGDAAPLSASHAGEPVSLYLHSYYPVRPNEEMLSQYDELEAKILDYYESTYAYRPAGVDFDSNRQDGVLFHVYGLADGNRKYTCGWYVMNPFTEEGYDLMTNEAVILNSLHGDIPLDGSYEEDKTMDAALNYYEELTGHRPGSVMFEENEDGLLLQLYDDMGTHTATCGWYVIDPVTMQGYDYMTGEQIDFSGYTNK